MMGDLKFRIPPLYDAQGWVDDYHIFCSLSYYDTRTGKNRCFKLSDYDFITVDRLFDGNITRILNKNPYSKVLDIACGYRYSPLLTIAETYPYVHAIGVDIAAQPRDLPENLEVLMMDARDINQLKPGFDLIYCHQFIYHMFGLGISQEKFDLMKDATGLLDPGGVLLIDDASLAAEIYHYNLNTKVAAALGAISVKIGHGCYEDLSVPFIQISNFYI